MFLICISLMTSNIEYLFMYLSAFHISCLEKCLLRYIPDFLIIGFFGDFFVLFFAMV